MLNSIVLQGRLVADPQVRQTTNGVKVASLRLASDRDTGGEKKTDFIDVTAWRNSADFAERWLKRGTMVLVRGRLETENYTDRDNNKRTSYKINAEHFWFCGPRPELDEQQTVLPLTENVEDGDLPF